MLLPRAGILGLLPLAAVLTVLADGAFAQDDNGRSTTEKLSGHEITEIRQRAETLLRHLAPRSLLLSVSYTRQMDQPIKEMVTSEGIIHWGNLFTRSETVALVNLAPPPVTDDVGYDSRPQYLYLFSWHGNQWIPRQFLGNAYNLSVHHRRDRPAVFLQGSRRTGRYDGDYLSWFYDPAKKRLVPTNFEDWGPFYLAGNYLILGHGFARLAHDDTHWIYAYKHGKKGKLLASLHINDHGHFDVERRTAKSGLMKHWSFAPKDENGERFTVGLEDAAQENNSDAGIFNGETSTAKFIGQIKGEQGGLSPEDYFGFLSGLNPALLDDKWMNELPKWSRPKQLPVTVTGDPEIVARFR